MESELNLSTLPSDVIFMIIDNLNYKDVNSLSCVNKSLYSVTNDNLLWRMKLEKDMNKWKILNSSNLPIEIYEKNGPDLDTLNQINYKAVYSKCCPDVLTQREILKKLKLYQNAEKSKNIQENSDESDSLLKSSINLLGQLKDFILNSSLFNEVNTRFLTDVQKIVMFGPGLETSTCCLVTNLLWKSDFETVGMIPGLNGYGSGLKLKLFNHEPFNLTILYTNVVSVRQNNAQNNLERNKLLIKNKNNDDSYEVNAQVKEACVNASGFVYVIDNNLLTECFYNQTANDSAELIKNYKQELVTLMKESNKTKPLLILSCTKEEVGQNNLKFLSCSKIIELFKLYELEHEWQVRSCHVFKNKMKDITMGFDWLLNKIKILE